MDKTVEFVTFSPESILKIEIPEDLQIYIVSSKERPSNYIYKKLIDNLPRPPVFLPTIPVACRIKLPQNGFFICLTDVCDIHRLEHCIVIQEKGTRKLQYSEDAFKITCNNPNIIKYYQMKHENLKINSETEIENFDRMQFLISRLARIEKAQNATIFGIYFTNPYFYEFANKLKNILKENNKKGYLFHVGDISFERLSCVDGLECAVVIDCEYYNWFHIELNIPLIVPFELSCIFTEWKGNYDINQFQMPEKQKENEICTELILQEHYNTGQLVKRNEIQAVPYFVEDESDDKIYEGYSGIAGNYQ